MKLPACRCRQFTRCMTLPCAPLFLHRPRNPPPQVVYNVGMKGQQLPFPPDTPHGLMALSRACTRSAARDRPTFARLQVRAGGGGRCLVRGTGIRVTRLSVGGGWGRGAARVGAFPYPLQDTPELSARLLAELFPCAEGAA